MNEAEKKDVDALCEAYAQERRARASIATLTSKLFGSVFAPAKCRRCGGKPIMLAMATIGLSVRYAVFCEKRCWSTQHAGAFLTGDDPYIALVEIPHYAISLAGDDRLNVERREIAKALGAHPNFKTPS